MLRSYFRTGWLFLLPYLALYLVYARYGWPVVEASALHPAIPTLRTLFWLLHAFHALGASFALVATCRESSRADRAAILSRLAPWLCLAAFFYLTGPYLEWPSDPWEHVRRINDWSQAHKVTDHSVWWKSSYFLLFSLVGHATGETQLYLLRGCYTATALLLAWQYHRLGRAFGFSPAVAFLFVLSGVLLLGNNVFSFYRYYGLSSSIFAQLAAVAVLRHGLEFARSRRYERAPLTSGTRTVGSVALLLIFAKYQHTQGVTLALAGLAAVAVGWLYQQHRRVFLALGALALLANIAFVARGVPPELAELQQSGFLSASGGFALFSIDSPAADRALQILGALGVLNLLAAILLWRRQPIAAAATLLPLVLLLLPIVAIPASSALLRHGGVDNVVVFARLLFAIPPGLALIALADEWQRNPPRPIQRFSKRGPRIQLPVAFTGATLAVLALLPASRPFYNRVWHNFAATPADLEVRDIWDAAPSIAATPTSKRTVTTQAGAALFALHPERSTLLELQPWRRANAHPFAGIANVQTLLTPNPSTAAQVPDKVHLTIEPNNWEIRGGEPPHIMRDSDGAAIPLALENQPSAASEIFLRRPLPLHRDRTYLVEMTLRGRPGGSAPTFFAVAWFDARGNLLRANEASPHGGDNPRGWTNGTYSYFALAGQTPPEEWTTWQFTFGARERAAPPPHAVTARVGVLLNPSGQRDVASQWAAATFRIVAAPAVQVFLPRPEKLFTARSWAALLSGHWLPQQVAIDRAGVSELNDFLRRHDVATVPLEAPAAR